MDFGSLLHVAQKNDQKPKNEIKYYSTKFEPPKKEERSKQLSDNIKKFLARKEAEEKQKALEAKVRREELLALRSQDRKATRRVQVMLKRTKSANKSVITDAVDNDNTAVTLAGPSQPDEDDYGYVSQEASAFYNKMMQKYNNMPEEDKFPKTKKNTNTNLKEIKDRVRAAILKEQEDALLPHKRKRKPKDRDSEIDDIRDENRYREEPEKKEKPKPKPAPPPLNFNDLLKIAEKKQFEPIKIEPKTVKEEERLMTKRQKREFEKEKAWRERKEKGITTDNSSDKPNMPPPNKIPKLSSSSNGKIPKLPNSEDRTPQRIPKLSNTDDRPQKNYKISNTDDRTLHKISKLSSNSDRSSVNSKPINKKLDERNPDRNITKKIEDKYTKRSDDRGSLSKRPEDRNGIKRSNGSPTNISDRRPDPSKVSKLRAELEKNRSAGVSKTQSSRPSGSGATPGAYRTLPPNGARPSLDKNKSLMRKDLNGNKDMRMKSLQNGDRPKQFPPADLRPKQFPPADLKPKQFPPSDVRPRFPPKDVKRKPLSVNKRRILDDDSEYDSEMDDFIDDGPDEEEDYSKYISEIFGYDKNRYRYVDDEDDNMESSFSQVMKEEVISSKIGLMEDLEDMKLEAEEKKRKALMKKKMMRK